MDKKFLALSTVVGLIFLGMFYVIYTFIIPSAINAHPTAGTSTPGAEKQAPGMPQDALKLTVLKDDQTILIGVAGQLDIPVDLTLVATNKNGTETILKTGVVFEVDISTDILQPGSYRLEARHPDGSLYAAGDLTIQ